MKFLIVGLGSFGASLAEKLTIQGNEVVGVDNDMEKVEALKEKITYTICLDATNLQTVNSLPVKNTDIVVVAIGENQESNILVTAIFKNMKVKRLISRAINPLHENILQAIGVDGIVHPEEEAAEQWAKKLCFANMVGSLELNDSYSVVEVKVFEYLVGKTLKEINFREKYGVLVLAIIRNTNSILSMKKSEVKGIPLPDEELKCEDILVLYGANKDLEFFM